MRERELNHFRILDPTQQREAITRLARSGMSETTIAAATSLSVEQIRAVLEPERATARSAKVPA